MRCVVPISRLLRGRRHLDAIIFSLYVLLPLLPSCAEKSERAVDPKLRPSFLGNGHRPCAATTCFDDAPHGVKQKCHIEHAHKTSSTRSCSSCLPVRLPGHDDDTHVGAKEGTKPQRFTLFFPTPTHTPGRTGCARLSTRRAVAFDRPVFQSGTTQA